MASHRSTFYFPLVVIFTLCFIIGTSIARPEVQDLDTSATGYGGYGGRVHISVHRGPTEKHGYHYFAPFSYYVRQPEDNHKGYY